MKPVEFKYKIGEDIFVSYGGKTINITQDKTVLNRIKMNAEECKNLSDALKVITRSFDDNLLEVD